MDTLLWYLAVSWDYVAQMLPCMLLAALVSFLLRPWRKKRLARQGMASGKLRETALLFFVMFCAGLAADCLSRLFLDGVPLAGSAGRA
jgi:hypothetical protein